MGGVGVRRLGRYPHGLGQGGVGIADALLLERGGRGGGGTLDAGRHAQSRRDDHRRAEPVYRERHQEPPPLSRGETNHGSHDQRDEEVIEKGDPGLKIDSVCPLWPGAEWMEREAYDMFGIIFVGHPDLRRILTWNGYGSYPLRKDYPLRGVGEREDYKIVTRDMV